MIMNKRTKNYIVLVVIFLIGMALTIYICDCYRVYDEYQKQTPVIRGTLSEITSEEIEHYILENPTSTIYMCTSSDDNCRKFEKKLIKLATKMNLQEYIVYLNLSDVDQNTFINQFNELYNFKVKLRSSYPAFVTFEDGKIKYILQGNDSTPLTLSKIKQFFELNSIGE